MSLRDTLSDKAQLSPSDVYLDSLLDQLPAYLLSSRSDSTASKYQGYFRRFQLFMSRQKKISLPANDVHVSLFIVHLLNDGASHQVVYSFVCAIKWLHSLHGFKDPTSSIHVKNLLETSKRRPKKPSHKKDIVSPDVIKQLFHKYSDCNDLLVLRDLAMIVVAFAGFLRYDELSNIRRNDLTFHSDHVKINIVKSKTDQYRDGNEIVLAKLNSASCRVAALKKYLSTFSDDFIFRPAYKTSRGKMGLKLQNKKLSYTRCREVLLSRLREVAPEGLNLGLHSLRAGGATAAANAEVEERCWKRHGRWRSNAAYRYIKDSVQTRLHVSEKLGL